MGRNSTDAETGQVGPEIAELMGIPHISQVRKLDFRAGSLAVVAERVTDEGYQVIQSSLPALACVTEGVAPEMYPSREQMAEAQEKPVEEANCAQLSSDLSQFGSSGSPTWVQDIRLVEPDRLGVVVEEENPAAAAQQVAGLLRERLGELAATNGGSESTSYNSRFPESRDKSIWVVAETFRGGLRRVTLEMLGKARQLTSFTKSEVAAVVVGSLQEHWSKELAAQGADRVMVLDTTSLGPAYGTGVAHALATAIDAARPYAVLFASTADGRDLASRIAARLGLGLTGDAIDLEVDEEGRLVQLKPALGGNVVAPILSKTLPNLVTLRPGLLTPMDPEPNAQPKTERIIAPDFQGADITVLEEHLQEDLGAIALAQAPVVLSVGMGIGGPENIPQISSLARSHRRYSGHFKKRRPRRLAAAPDPGGHQRTDHSAQSLLGRGN